MKLLQVMAGAKSGGAETAFIDTCIAMRNAGFDVRAAVRKNDSRNARLSDAGIVYYELPFGGVLDFKTRRKLKKIIAAFKPVIVQTWMSRAAAKTPASPHPKQYLNVSRLGGYYSIKYFRTADYFVAITPDIGRHLIDQGVEPDRIVQINNLADTETDAIPVRRQDVDTPEGATVVLALSRLHDSKALDTLISSVKTLPDIHVWLAGEGPEREKLVTLTRESGLHDRVHFLGWRTDRAALLAACDICCFPSRYEPFGTVFVQAWAAGKPVIVSNAQGPIQFVRDREDALVFEIDDTAALARHIAALAADADLRRHLVENGRARYENEFTTARTMAAYRAFYETILRRESVTR